MTPKGLLGGIDAGKLAINSLSGFIVTVAIIFFIDALISSHMTQDIIINADFETVTVVGLIIVVTSAVTGLMVDSVFHSAGRGFAQLFCSKVGYEIDFRKKLMQDVGLTEREFEWVKATGKGLSEAVETKIMRFTEVAGGSAYALFLLAPATALFLCRDYALSVGFALFVASVITVAGVILLYTSASALAKYESRQTAVALDEIRKLSSSRLCSVEQEEGEERKGARVLLSLLPVALGIVVILASLLLLAMFPHPLL